MFFISQEKAYLYRTSLYLAASASAEFFADIALAPMEAVKVRIQTQPGWANNLREGVPKLWRQEGVAGYELFLPYIVSFSLPSSFSTACSPLKVLQGSSSTLAEADTLHYDEVCCL